MFARATGWLGYTPREALEANVNDLGIALGGFKDLLASLFGGGEKPAETPKSQPMSAARFRAIAEAHNRARSVGAKADGRGRGTRRGIG